MAQLIKHDRYPKFVADQVLTEKSLNQMFGYLEEQQRLSRTTLIGIGILCGMEVSVNAARTALTISQGVGVTSKGYLVPFPETTYTFYNDEFSAEQEFMYAPFIDQVTQQQKFPLYLMHNNGAAEIKKPITAAFLEDKAVVIFVELLKVDNKNCDPDSCDDKGCTVEVTHRPLLVSLDDLDELIFDGNDQGPFLNEPTCIEWPEIRMPRYNVPATFLLSSQAVLKNFLDVLTSDFMLNIENTLSAAYSSFGYYIQDEFPNNPFPGLKNSFSFLYNGSIGIEQLLFVQYYYDFFSDLILAYEELRKMCNECLTLCCPNEDLFPRHLILGNAIPAADGFRHHWIASPAFACDCCSEGRIKFLLKKIVLLIRKLDLPKNIFANDTRKLNVRITPSRYGNTPLSEKAIPYYYNIVNPPNELYDNWNFKKTKLNKGNTNLSYDAEKYNSNPYIKDPLGYDIEPYNFMRIEGHLGLNWKNALAGINKIKYEKRLPIDVVALNGDIFELIRSLLTDANSLADIITGNKDIASELWCYFADIESQYDAHAAELRCTLLKVMAYFYNLKVIGNDGQLTPTQKLPESDMVRKAFPNYRTFKNSYGEQFDDLYAKVKNQPYITPQAFFDLGTNNQDSLLSPIYLMYYLEKIHEALPDGLVKLQINVLTQRLEDASLVAAIMLAVLDNLPEFKLPAMWEESLDAVIRLCKAEVFNVLYRNFLINYVLFIANQSFAWYAFKNPGVQHKAGVTTGGTFILVYNDKREIREVTRAMTGTVRAVTGAPLPGVNVIEKGTTNGTITNFTGNYSITVTNPNAILVASVVGHVTKEVSTTGLNKVDIILTNLAAGTEFSGAAPPKAGNPLDGVRATKATRAAGNPIMDLRYSEASIKATVLRDIFDLVDGQRSDKSLSDEALSELVNQFPDGTVIADFFVPNMCKAACMPMNFIVMGDKDTDPGETDIRLDIKPREFCEDDQNNYDIRVAPEGGVLKVDNTVINSPIFKPGSLAVGNEPLKEAIITYEINSDVRNIRVRVYKKPVVGIGIASIDHVNHVVEFKNETTFADRYAWNFGNGQFSDKQDPGPIGFGNAQTAIITLKAFNGPCENESQPLTVSFEDQPDDGRTCTPIDELGEKFKFLDEISSAEFKEALQEYPLLKLIFIEKFGDIVGLPQEEQCKLLLTEIKVSTIQRIIRVLNTMVRSNKELSRSALLLYEVLLKLALFYSCCQDGDVNDAGTNMETTLKIMVGHIESWQEQIEFTDEEKSILESMLVAVQKELDKTTEETPEKNVYIDFLKMLVEALSKLL